MRYKEGEKVLFKFHSGITDAEDFKVGDVVTQMESKSIVGKSTIRQ